MLLVFIRGITDSCEKTEEFLAMESLKMGKHGERTGSTRCRGSSRGTSYLGVRIDGSLNLSSKNVGLLKRIQESLKEDNPEQEVIILHFIIHQEALCKSVS